MAKRRKKADELLKSDPHEWLKKMLASELEHPAKVERAVTALTGFEFIAGREQGAGKDRPFDHMMFLDVIRLDTKSQEGGELDVKKEKPGKQVTAWSNSGKRFIPVQLVLDMLTGSWYVVVGIPTGTVTLDPLVTRFNPKEPLVAFKIAEGTLDDLLDKARFLALKDIFRAARVFQGGRNTLIGNPPPGSVNSWRRSDPSGETVQTAPDAAIRSVANRIFRPSGDQRAQSAGCALPLI